MNCSLCNGEIEIKEGVHFFESKIIGDLFVPAVEFEECMGCGDKTLSPESSAKVIQYVRHQEQIVIGNLPSSDLVTATQAAAILGVTKQAFSKNPKIKRGFVYFVIIGNRRAYFQRSLELFMQTGDGRFLIPSWRSVSSGEMVSGYSSTDWNNQFPMFASDDTPLEQQWNTEQEIQ